VATPQWRESRARDCLVILAHQIPPHSASYPSLGPLRPVKAPAAVHLLPKGESKTQSAADRRGPDAL